MSSISSQKPAGARGVVGVEADVAGEVLITLRWLAATLNANSEAPLCTRSLLVPIFSLPFEGRRR